MNNEERIIINVVLALRDTAAKAMEKTRVENKSNYSTYREEERFTEYETYSRDWIIGRLLGMADTIDALTTTADLTAA